MFFDQEANTGGERNPPQYSLFAEQALLTSILIDPSILSLPQVVRLETRDFFDEDHGAIFEAMRSLEKKRIPLSEVGLAHHLQRFDVHSRDEAYWVGVFRELKVDSCDETAAASYAKIIREHGRSRMMTSALETLLVRARDGRTSSARVLEEAFGLLTELSNGHHASEPMRVGEILRNPAFELAHPTAATKPQMLKTGFAEFDEFSGGFANTELVILGGRPSMGKTAWALDVARNCALRSEHVLVFSIEMNRRAVANRILAAQCRINGHRLRTGEGVTGQDVKAVKDHWPEMAKAPLFIVDDAGLTASRIWAKARAYKNRTGKLDLVVVDYVQLLKPEGGHNRNDEVGRMTQTLKEVAKDLKVPVLAISQLSRASEHRRTERGGRGDGRPILADLRDSGMLEQTADIVVFVHRAGLLDPREETLGLAEIIIAKHRNGRVGTIEMVFLEDCTRFENIEKRTLP